MNGGYRLIGETNRGWLYKTGFSLRKSGRPLDIDNRPCIRDFLRPLQQLEQKFSLTAATSMNGKWLGIDTLLQLANSRSRADWNMLMELRVCVFAPEDYLDRIQTYFRKQGRFPATSSSDSLAFRINTSGMKKKEIAELIGISPSALSEFLSGRRNWPKEVAKRLEGVLSDVPPGENFSKNGSN